jgi:hypothetical protein
MAALSVSEAEVEWNRIALADVFCLRQLSLNARLPLPFVRQCCALLLLLSILVVASRGGGAFASLAAASPPLRLASRPNQLRRAFLANNALPKPTSRLHPAFTTPPHARRPPQKPPKFHLPKAALRIQKHEWLGAGFRPSGQRVLLCIFQKTLLHRASTCRSQVHSVIFLLALPPFHWNRILLIRQDETNPRHSVPQISSIFAVQGGIEFYTWRRRFVLFSNNQGFCNRRRV